MKKIAFFVALTLSVSAFAQVSDVQRADAAISKCLLETQDAKKSVKPATWIKLARAYENLYQTEMGIGAGFIGSPDTLLVKATLAGDPALTEENVVIANQNFKKRCYATHNYYFDVNNILRLAEITVSVCPDALLKAVEAYQRATELDVKGAKTSEISQALTNINSRFCAEAQTAFMLGDVEKSSLAFVNAVSAMAAKPLCRIDTLSTYNVAFTSIRVGNDARAKEYFQKCLDIDYQADGMVYYNLSEIAGREGDETLQKQYLEEGFKRFPQCEFILFGIINFYTSHDLDPSRIFAMLDMVKELEPDNISIYCVEGSVHYKLGQYDKAAESFRKCMEIAPEKPDGYVQLGILYYNRAIEISSSMMNVTDAAQMEQMSRDTKENLRLTIEPFEKVVALTEGNPCQERLSALQGLKSACFQLRFDDPSYLEKYNLYKGKLDEMTQASL